jgi:mono/diheme cytochrome c family protein
MMRPGGNACYSCRKPPPGKRGRKEFAIRRLALLTLILLAHGAASANDLPSGAAAGQILFQTYCASCHGVLGDGNGPAAAALRTSPADLTRLTERHGLPLPRHTIAELIDGRLDVAAHGSREMPVWGEVFFPSEPGGSPNRERAKQRSIQVIIDYLETIQRLRTTRAAPPAR